MTYFDDEPVAEEAEAPEEVVDDAEEATDEE